MHYDTAGYEYRHADTKPDTGSSKLTQTHTWCGSRDLDEAVVLSVLAEVRAAHAPFAASAPTKADDCRQKRMHDAVHRCIHVRMNTLKRNLGSMNDCCKWTVD
eukprot:187890-Rhodomonas_salina.1